MFINLAISHLPQPHVHLSVRKTLTSTLSVSAALTRFFPSFLSLSLVTQWMQAQLPLTLRPTWTTPPTYPQHENAGDSAGIPSASSLGDPPPITHAIIRLLKTRPSHNSDSLFHCREVQIWRDKLELEVVSYSL